MNILTHCISYIIILYEMKNIYNFENKFDIYILMPNTID